MRNNIPKKNAKKKSEVFVNVKVPTELHSRFKAKCALNQQSLGDVVVKMMQQYVDEIPTH